MEKIMDCPVCKERQIEITRILKAYKAEKMLLYRIIGVLIGLLVFVAGLGNDALRAIFISLLEKIK